MASRTSMRFMRPFTTRFLNPVFRLVAGRLPGFGILVYPGRKTGREYRTPINVFRRDGAFLFALTYGSDVDWVRNVVAAGGCTIETRGRRVRLTDPQVFDDPSRRLMPLPLRWMFRLTGVSEFLRMRAA